MTDGVTIVLEGLDELTALFDQESEIRTVLAEILAEEADNFSIDLAGSGRRSRLAGRTDGLTPIDTGLLLNTLLPSIDGLGLVVRSSLKYASFAHFTGEQVGQAAADVEKRFREMIDTVAVRWEAETGLLLGARA